MKVLHYIPSLSRTAGGLYYSVSGLSKSLSTLGVGVSVIGGANKHFEEDRHIWGDLPLYPHSLRFSYALDFRVFREIKRQRPDLLHIHGIWCAASMYGRFATLLGIPVVVSPRGMLDPWILSRKSTVKAIHALALEKPLLTKAYFHALNDAEKDAGIGFLPSLRDRTFVIPNGIPGGLEHEPVKSTRDVLYIGRLHEKKQVLQLIEAWKRRESTDQNLVIAGWGDSDYEERVKQAVQGASNVRFVGPLYGDAKLAALQSSQFFILPSLSEGLPMAVLEALQHGCIPILTDGCNLPELFADRIAYRMSADFSDFDSVVNAALSLSTEESKARSIEAANYSKRYLWSTIAKSMLDKYESIIARDRIAVGV